MPPLWIRLTCLTCDTTWITPNRDWSTTGTETCFQCGTGQYITVYNPLLHDTYAIPENQ